MNLLAGYKLAAVLQQNINYALSFTKGSSSAYAVWTTNAQQLMGVSMPAGTYQAYDYLGNKGQVLKSDGQKAVPVTATSAPQYILPI